MISVCIASHNGGLFIREQIESILCQLAFEDEIIISDDGSTDDTVSQILQIDDSRVHLYKYKQPVKFCHPHICVCRNFENALKYAIGDYIFLADQDDFWLPDKVNRCLEHLKTNTLVVHQAEICDANLTFMGKFMYKDNFVFKNFLSLKRGKYYGCTLAFRRELLSYVLPFPKYLVLHDQWIGCMAELIGNVVYEKTPYIRYRYHGNNTSAGKSSNSSWFKVEYRVYLFFNLLLRTIRK